MVRIPTEITITCVMTNYHKRSRDSSVSIQTRLWNWR